jgi:hypothetical protein
MLNESNIFSFLSIIQNYSRIHQNSYPLGTTGLFPGGKAARDVKLTTLPQTAEAKKM